MPEQVFFFLGELDFIVANITTIIMLLTLISLLLANLARYVQAKNYGIPLKMVHQASIPDSLDIWITLICVFGFGMVIPWVMISVRAYIPVVFAVIFVSCLIGIASTKITVGTKRKNKKDGTVRDVNLSWRFYLLVALFTAIFFTYLNAISTPAYPDYYEAPRNLMQTILLVMARIQQGLHALCLFLPLIAHLYKKTYGNQDLMTVEIENQLYLIAMRHVANYWVLIPCTVGRVKPRGDFTIGPNNDENDFLTDGIIFTKGKFIVRDISLLDGTKNILCRDSYALVGTKEEAQTQSNPQDDH